MAKKLGIQQPVLPAVKEGPADPEHPPKGHYPSSISNNGQLTGSLIEPYPSTSQSHPVAPPISAGLSFAIPAIHSAKGIDEM